MSLCKIKAQAKSPHDMQVISYQRGTQHSTKLCPAWLVQHEIEELEHAGYTVLEVLPDPGEHHVHATH